MPQYFQAEKINSTPFFTRELDNNMIKASDKNQNLNIIYLKKKIIYLPQTYYNMYKSIIKTFFSNCKNIII